MSGLSVYLGGINGRCGWAFEEKLRHRLVRAVDTDPWYREEVRQYHCIRHLNHGGDHEGRGEAGMIAIWPVNPLEIDPGTQI